MSSRVIIIAIAVLAALGALGGFAVYVRKLGYQDGFTDASAACEAEKRKIEQANDQAITDAERELMRAADGVSLKQLEIDDALSRNDQAAAADPSGDSLCLPPLSVQRLNTIR
jgi:hypothetical protein